MSQIATITSAPLRGGGGRKQETFLLYFHCFLLYFWFSERKVAPEISSPKWNFEIRIFKDPKDPTTRILLASRLLVLFRREDVFQV